MTKHDPCRSDRVLFAIDTFTREHGYPPTVREIGDAVGLKSTAAVDHHLRKLVRAGLIVRDPLLSRSVRLVADPGVCGACGGPLR